MLPYDFMVRLHLLVLLQSHFASLLHPQPLCSVSPSAGHGAGGTGHLQASAPLMQWHGVHGGLCAHRSPARASTSWSCVFLAGYPSHTQLIKVRSGGHRPLGGQGSFGNVFLLKRVQRGGFAERLTPFRARLLSPSLQIPRLDFRVFMQQQGSITAECPGTCWVLVQHRAQPCPLALPPCWQPWQK